MKSLILVLFILWLSPLFGQTEESVQEIDTKKLEEEINLNKAFQSGREVKKGYFKISPLTPWITVKTPLLRTPAISYERQLRPELTLNLMGFGTFNFHSTFLVFPNSSYKTGLALGLRYYYNMNERLLADKPVSKFSANYIGVNIGNDSYNNFLNVLWGIQRSFGKRFFYDVSGGFQNSGRWDSEFFLLANFQIGLIF